VASAGNPMIRYLGNFGDGPDRIGAEQYRRTGTLQWLGAIRYFVEMEILAVKRHAVFAPEPANNLQTLDQSVAPLAQSIRRI